MTDFFITFIGAFSGITAAEVFLQWWANRPRKMG